jgi:hypothetical protein
MIFTILITLALHFLLSWPCWVGILLIGLGRTSITLFNRCKLGLWPDIPIWTIIPVALIEMLTTYIPMIIVLWLVGRQSW